eukprot:6210728-Pleurochrysis_carterae.AAC.2
MVTIKHAYARTILARNHKQMQSNSRSIRREENEAKRDMYEVCANNIASPSNTASVLTTQPVAAGDSAWSGWCR